MDTDCRWKQRLDSFEKALGRLADAVALSKQRALSDLESQGLIQAFEFTHELAWNLLKDYFVYQGDSTSVTGSRDAFRLAFSRGLVSDGEGWMETISARNKSSHIYDDSIAAALQKEIVSRYCPLFEALRLQMRKLAEDQSCS